MRSHPTGHDLDAPDWIRKQLPQDGKEHTVAIDGPNHGYIDGVEVWNPDIPRKVVTMTYRPDGTFTMKFER